MFVRKTDLFNELHVFKALCTRMSKYIKGTSGKGAALRIEHGCSSSKQKMEAQKK